jgi:hypothetical protein
MASILALTFVAVSGFVVQIGLNTRKTAAVSIAATGKLPSTGRRDFVLQNK